ncbi:MAG: hypothetical protein ACXVPU_08700 [Bacteroidia bacterium]
MKRVFILGVIFWTFTINMSGQKISKEEAQVLLDKAFTALKNSDTTSFLDLWFFDNSTWFASDKPFTKQDARIVFKEIKVFLDTALTTNMKIDEIEITPYENEENVKGKIKAYYKYDSKTNYIKAVGYNIDYVNKKWVFRFHPEYTTGFRTYGKAKKK